MRVYGATTPNTAHRWVVEVSRDEMARSTHNHRLFQNLMAQGTFGKLTALFLLAENLECSEGEKESPTTQRSPVSNVSWDSPAVRLHRKNPQVRPQ